MNDVDMVKLIQKDFSSFLEKLFPDTQISFSHRYVFLSNPQNRITRSNKSQYKYGGYVQKNVLSIRFCSLKQKNKILRKSKMLQVTRSIDPIVQDSQQKHKTVTSLQIKERNKESLSHLNKHRRMQLQSQSSASTTFKQQIKKSEDYNNIDENNAEWLRSMLGSKNSLCDMVCNRKYINTIASDNSSLFLLVKHDTNPSETADYK